MSGVVGLDLSLTGTGIATATSTRRVGTEPKHGDTIQRSGIIWRAVLETLQDVRPALVVVESPAFAATGGQGHERGYLWWRVMEVVQGAGVPWKKATPQMLKKYATGSGAADKDAMVLAAARRFEWFTGKNDEADALWACAMGYEFLGSPILAMPKVNREALDTWVNPKPAKKSRVRVPAAA